MGYYVRAFCTEPHVPDLAAIQRWLGKRGSKAILDDPNHAVEAARTGSAIAPVLQLATSDWEQVAVAYKRGKLPILAECNRDNGAADSLLRQEVAEFTEFVGEAAPSPAKQRVLQHLRATTFIIACQLPMSDIDDDGYTANGDFLRFFAEQSGGIIQADGEGFYEGSTLALPLA